MTQTSHLALVRDTTPAVPVHPLPVDVLSPVDAEALTVRARGHLEAGISDLIEAWERQAWVALDYPSWDAYLEDRFGDLRSLRLPAGPRRERVALMRRAGVPVRDIARTPGMGGKSTVGDDLKALRESGVDLGEESGVRSADGIRRPATRTPAPVVEVAPVPRVAIVLGLVRDAGPAGLTVAALKAATGWGHQEASPALSRLAASGRLVYRAGEKRGRMGSYILP